MFGSAMLASIGKRQELRAARVLEHPGPPRIGVGVGASPSAAHPVVLDSCARQGSGLLIKRERPLMLSESQGRPASAAQASRTAAAPGEAIGVVRNSAVGHSAEVSTAERADDQLIGISDIRRIFKLGRTAAYDLTHRPDFPEAVMLSARCYRWWASEVDAFADTLRSKPTEGAARRARRPYISDPAVAPLQITGTVRSARVRKEAS